MYLRKKNQQGSMIVMAVFVIVVMSMLALNLMRLKASNQGTLVRENLGAQAWFLSISAGEWALTQMYPLDATATAVELTTRCTNLNNVSQEVRSKIADGFPCNALTISCANPSLSLPSELVYFQITTSAVCGSGDFTVQRGEQIWVRPL